MTEDNQKYRELDQHRERISKLEDRVMELEKTAVVSKRNDGILFWLFSLLATAVGFVAKIIINLPVT